MTKTAFLLTVGVGAALALAACTPPTPRHRGGWSSEDRAVSKLDCPESQGVLKRQSVDANGKACVYAADDGAEVNLQLIDLDGMDPGTALSPLETQLRAELPPRAQKPAGAAEAPGDGKDDVDIDLPGIHIHAKGNGEAHVDAGRVNVQADDRGAHVQVRKDVTVRDEGDGRTVVVDNRDGRGGVSVDADDSGAEIHVDHSRRGGVRVTFILASETPGPRGYRLAGYEARGPRGGPIVVASMKSKSDDRDSLFHDMRSLLNRNVGG